MGCGCGSCEGGCEGPHVVLAAVADDERAAVDVDDYEEVRWRRRWGWRGRIPYSAQVGGLDRLRGGEHWAFEFGGMFGVGF